MKKLLLVFGLLGLAIIPHKVINVSANTTSSASVSVSVPTSTSTSVSVEVEEQEPEQEETLLETLENKVNDIWNTQVMPIIASISLVSVVNFIYSWVMARKNKKTTEQCSQTVENITALMNKTLELSSGITNELKDSKEVIDNLKVNFNNAINEFVTIANKLIYETKNIQDIRPLLSAMSEIITKFALSSHEIVKAGVGEEIAELQRYIKSI